MNVERRPLGRVGSAEWDGLARNSFFASRGFLELWRCKGGRPTAWVRIEGGRVVAAVPGVEFHRGPLTTFASVPDGCYGGVLVAPGRAGERPEHARALLDAIARHGYAKVWVFDYHATAGVPAGYTLDRSEALVADIAGEDWAPPDAKLRAQIRKAEREGVRLEWFDWDRHHRGFLDLVAGSARLHHQRPRYPPALYRALAELARRDERVRWVCCERDGRPVASHIYFREGDALQAWQSHLDRSFSHLKANQYLRYTLCREVARQGVRWLNLGSSPPQAVGLAKYKARWGGRPVGYACWTRRSGLAELLEAWRTRPGHGDAQLLAADAAPRAAGLPSDER